MEDQQGVVEFSFCFIQFTKKIVRNEGSTHTEERINGGSTIKNWKQ